MLQLGQERFEEAEKHGAADYLRDQITFLKALGQCEPDQEVALVLIRQLDMVFIDPVLIKSLLDAPDKDMSFALDMCRALISQLGPSSIRTRIINKIAGGQGSSEVCAQEDEVLGS